MIRRKWSGHSVVAAVFAFIASAPFLACGDGSLTNVDGRPDNTGAACTNASDCYGGLDSNQIKGSVECIDNIPGGYCSHTCTADADCCAAPGECAENVHEVCSPFENDKDTRCFISCEHDDLFAADGTTGDVDPQEFCQRVAGASFQCRSSGGGHENRDICVPVECGSGAQCGSDSDCGDGLACNTDFDGGYCGAKSCTSDGDCAHDAHCANVAAGSFCMKNCGHDEDCASCRSTDFGLHCEDTPLAGGDSSHVCVP